VLGIRAPAQFPIVFSWASVAALLWFWWRYHILWLNQSARSVFRNAYLRELHQRKPFNDYVAKHVNHQKITNSYSKRTNRHLPPDTTYIGYDEIGPTDQPRLLIHIGILKYNDGKTNHNADQIDFPGERVIELRVPWWFHWIHSPGFFLWKVIREESFANQLLPQIVFAMATFLIVCKAFGYDPVGLFGLLTDPSAPSNSCQSDFTGWLSVFGAFTTKTKS